MTFELRAGRGRIPTAHGYVVETLRAAILDGTLPGGTRLIQTELARQMGVSITPVREALRDLAGEGLVVVDAHRGSRVHSLDLNEVRELYEMRIALEPLLVRRVIKTFPAENLQRCEALLRRLVVTTDRAQWSELNRELHSLLAGDHQGRLSVLLGGLRDSASRYVALSLGADEERIEQSNAEHADLIDAYRAGDARRAVALTVQHLRATLATIEAAASGAGDAGLSG